MTSKDYADEFVDKFFRGGDTLEPETSEAELAPTGIEQTMLKEQVIQALMKIYDPEIPVNIYDLGLVYAVNIDANGFADVQMTLTAPGCPVAHTFPGMVECAVKDVPGICDAHVELVWDPPWSKDRISEAALLELGLL